MNTNRGRSLHKTSLTMETQQQARTKENTQNLTSNTPFQGQLPAANQNEVRLKEKDFSYVNLSLKQASQRAIIFKEIIKMNQDYLELRMKTVDIGLRLFDYYCFKRLSQSQLQDNLNKNPFRIKILDNKEENKELLLFCLFLAAKYNEIYPPSVNDFFWYRNSRVRQPELLRVQKDILTVTNFRLTVSTASLWHEFLWNAAMPEWGLSIYQRFPFAKAEHIARAIHFVVETTNGNTVSTDDLIKMTEEILDKYVKLEILTKGKSVLVSLSTQRK